MAPQLDRVVSNVAPAERRPRVRSTQVLKGQRRSSSPHGVPTLPGLRVDSFRGVAVDVGHSQAVHRWSRISPPVDSPNPDLLLLSLQVETSLSATLRERGCARQECPRSRHYGTHFKNALEDTAAAVFRTRHSLFSIWSP